MAAGRTETMGAGPVHAHIDTLQNNNSPIVMAHILNEEPDQRVKQPPVVTTSQEQNRNFGGAQPCGLQFQQGKTPFSADDFKKQSCVAQL